MKRVLTAMLLAAVSMSAWAGELQPKQVAAGAVWVAHVDVQAFLGSQTGQLLVDLLKEQSQFDSQLKAFVATWGFNPLKDLKGVTFYGTDFTPDSMVAIGNGTYSKDTLLKWLKANKDHTESPYGDFTIHHWIQPPENPGENGVRFGVFYSDDTVVIARTKETLEKAIDVMQGKANSLDPKADLLPEQPKGTFAVAVVKGRPPQTPKPNGLMFWNPSPITKSITGGHYVVGELDKKLFVTGALTAASDKEAKKIRQIAQGWVAMAQMAQEDNPQSQPAMVNVLAGITIAGESNQVTLNASLSVDDLKVMANEVRKAREIASQAVERAASQRAQGVQSGTGGASSQPA